ncbi:MAG: hypothetical protein BGO78_08800 [Chloroflexi bacterium 44-23]|nr:MAG: hypothetical protein BGO78_08800 [Chloroflexi bacterium 44-23]
MEQFTQFLVENPLLLLFLVIGIGYPLGRLKIGGVRLGVAFILFVGLAFGSLGPNVQIPEEIYMFGLVLFIYTIGLSNGSIFFEALRKRGLNANLLATIGSGLTLVVSLLFMALLDIKASYVAGIVAGATTNTPSLAAAVETLKIISVPEVYQQVFQEPIVAYSLTYPMGVLGVILVITLFQRLLKIKPITDKPKSELKSVTVRVTLAHPVTIENLMKENHWDVSFSRHKRGQMADTLVIGKTELRAGDLINLVGETDVVSRAAQAIGNLSPERIELDLSQFDRRRIILSNKELAGQKLYQLELATQYGAFVTHIRRGDLDFVPHGNTNLMLGDMLIVQAPHDRMEALAKYLGDSYRSVSEIDVLTLGLGVALGLLVGIIPIPLPGGLVLKLGIAGGPLIVGVFLGAIKRTGPINWDLPYGANVTLRQIGLVVFLAGVGTRSGYTFLTTLLEGGSFDIFLAGLILTVSVTAILLLLGHFIFKLPFPFLVGIISGFQTNSAILGFVQDQFGDEQPSLGYTTVYPLAMILKIILVQIILFVK